MAKKSNHPKPAASKSLAPTTPQTPAAPKTLDIQLTHSEHWPAAIAFRDRASKIVIGDQKSHAGALREIKDGKDLRRATLKTWKDRKDRVNAVRNALLDLEKSELGAIDAGLDPLEARAVAWKRTDDARVAKLEAEIREANERAAREERERELKKAEAEAQRIEDESPDLSARELWFVTQVFEQGIDLDSTATVDLTALGVICKQAGYAEPRVYAERLAKSAKIRTYLAGLVEAKAKRDQAAALREEPIFTPAPVVESKAAKVAGVRFTKTYTLDRVADLDAFIAAYRRGDLPDEAMVPNDVHLRAMAKDLKEKFPQAYPGATLKIDEGVAG